MVKISQFQKSKMVVATIFKNPKIAKCPQQIDQF